MKKVIFVPCEATPNEPRSALSPDSAKRLIKLGFEVLTESGIGRGSYWSDTLFKDLGVQFVSQSIEGYRRAKVVAQFHPPLLSQVDGMAAETLHISFLWPHQNPELIQQMKSRGVMAFGMDLIPRISRAQSMDALSSQASLAGYRAVILAAEYCPTVFPLMTTAAGTIKAAKVVVLGAGVAGLQAIATAKRLGAVVEVSDVRTAAKEQVESLGGKFIQVPGMESLEGQGGYAKEASKEFLIRQKELVNRHIVAADVVITTALIPGKPAPRLIDKEVVEQMKPGSVIVDMAVEQGGNCEASRLGEVVSVGGVKIVGFSNLAAQIPIPASSVYSRNVLSVVEHFFPKGEWRLDTSDEITAQALLLAGGNQ